MHWLGKLIVLGSVLITVSCTNLQTDTGADSQVAGSEYIVLTSVGPIYSITKALLEDTSIEVINMPERARSLAAQPTWLARQSEPFYELFENASAVVSMGHLWQYDSLYLTVREQNISVVNIDATLPYSSQLTGVSIVSAPSTGEVSPYFWLSPANLIRSAKIISNDLTRLFPDQADNIRNNEQQISSELLAIKRDFEVELANSDPYIYALADEFSYLTTEFGIYVEDYFVKQDIHWTESDLTNLTADLTDSGVPIVIHKWEPSEEIQLAIQAAGSTLVVLNTFETSTLDITTIASENLQKLIAALPKL